MALNTLKILEKFGVKHKEIQARPDDELKAIEMYVRDVHYDVEKLNKMLKQLQRLRAEGRMITDEHARNENLRKQLEIYDRLLVDYEYYEHDADINGIRVKNVAKYYYEQAQKHKLHDWVEKIKKEARWFFDW